MHIFIDDTYGPETNPVSRYVTARRRTSVAIVIPDVEVEDHREGIKSLLYEVNKRFGISTNEFHFSDIYNRRAPWDLLPVGFNITIYEFFCDIYSQFRWPVYLQTIDDRTLSDRNFAEVCKGKVEGLELENREDLALAILLLRLKNIYYDTSEPITLIVDEKPTKKSGVRIGEWFFGGRKYPFNGLFSSSKSEPLLQMVDFMAFSINRATHLIYKPNRTDFDNYILSRVGTMGINTTDLIFRPLPPDFTPADADKLHDSDRINKGLPIL